MEQFRDDDAGAYPPLKYPTRCPGCDMREGYKCLDDCSVAATKRWHAEQTTDDAMRCWASDTPVALKQQVGGDHYKTLAIQPIEYITKNNLGWCEGNVIKYISRWKQKGHHADLDKVIHYVNLLKELTDTTRN